MTREQVIRGLLSISGALAGASEAQAYQRIASFLRIEPQGTRRQRLGSPEALALGSGLFSNDIVESAPRRRLDLAFADGKRIGVGLSSQVTLDSYVYRPGAVGASAALDMAKGAMRFISNNVQRDGMRITTPTATIRVRGTDLVVTVAPSRATHTRRSGNRRVVGLRLGADRRQRLSRPSRLFDQGRSVLRPFGALAEATTGGSAPTSTTASAAVSAIDGVTDEGTTGPSKGPVTGLGSGPGNGNGNGGIGGGGARGGGARGSG